MFLQQARETGEFVTLALDALIPLELCEALVACHSRAGSVHVEALGGEVCGAGWAGYGFEVFNFVGGGWRDGRSRVAKTLETCEWWDVRVGGEEVGGDAQGGDFGD